MSEKEVEHKIFKVFECVRSNPNAVFDEISFLDFLTDPPHQKNTIKNSYRGKKKYYKFMYKLELEFKICFSHSELDQYYSINTLTQKILKRLKKDKKSKRILQKREEKKKNYNYEIMLLVVSIGLLYWQGINWVSILLTMLFIITIFRLLRWKFFNQIHIKKMNKLL